MRKAKEAGFPDTPLMRGRLQELSQQYTEEWVAEAIRQAGESGHPTLPYLQGILSRFTRQGNTATAEKTRKAYGTDNPATQYEQRSYADEPEFPEWMMEMARKIHEEETAAQERDAQEHAAYGESSAY